MRRAAPRGRVARNRSLLESSQVSFDLTATLNCSMEGCVTAYPASVQPARQGDLMLI